MDNRSWVERGLPLAAQRKLRPSNLRNLASCVDKKVAILNPTIADINGKRLLDFPVLALDALMADRGSRFEMQHLIRFVASHTCGRQQYEEVMDAVLMLPQLSRHESNNYLLTVEIHAEPHHQQPSIFSHFSVAMRYEVGLA